MVDCGQPAPDFGGYDYEFVEDVPDHLMCIVCLGAFKEPHLLSCCGWKVCCTCITRVKNAGQPCPHCRDPNFVTLLDRDFNRQVLNLRVYCSNKGNGCNWSNELRQLDKHLEGCEFRAIPCQWGCGQSFIRAQLQQHQDDDCQSRPPELKLKKAVDRMEARVVTLEGEVGDLKTLCGNQQNEIDRLHQQLHQAQEEHQKEKEKFQELLKKQETKIMLEIENKKREDSAQMDHLVAKQLNQLDQMSAQIKRELSHRIEQISATTHNLKYQQDNLKKKLGDDLEGVKNINLQMQGEMRQRFQTSQDEAANSFATKASLRRLQDILEKMSRHGKKVPEWQLPIPVLALSDVAPCQYTMHNFSLHKSNQKTWYSPPFYNEPGGYKFCLRVDSHGMLEGKATHLSVWVYVMRGLHDEALKWPFTGKVTVQLLNWKTDRSHIQNIIAFDDQAGDKVRQRVTAGDVAATGRGSSRFVSHETLQANSGGRGSAEFVKDDCLCFRIWRVDIV